MIDTQDTSIMDMEEMIKEIERVLEDTRKLLKEHEDKNAQLQRIVP